jgi:hypothetical protein
MRSVLLAAIAAVLEFDPGTTDLAEGSIGRAVRP